MLADLGNLDSFLYQYLVGGLLFGFGLWCGIRTGVLSPTHRDGRRALLLLTAGFAFFILLHGSLLVFGK